MRLRGLVISFVLAAMALVMAATGVAARGPNCIGDFATSQAGPGFGRSVAEVARVLQPLGRSTVGPAASSNDCSGF
jgi:hypothetical protein